MLNHGQLDACNISVVELMNLDILVQSFSVFFEITALSRLSKRASLCH